MEYPAPSRPPPEEYYNRRQVVYEPDYAPPRERTRPAYRELPTHKMPDYYNTKYEEENSGKVCILLGNNHWFFTFYEKLFCCYCVY